MTMLPGSDAERNGQEQETTDEGSLSGGVHADQESSGPAEKQAERPGEDDDPANPPVTVRPTPDPSEMAPATERGPSVARPMTMCES
jgi:hypothetical protein